MDKLANYGSDDDYDDSPQYKRTEFRPSAAESRASAAHHHHHQQQPRRASPQVDVNYDEVQMDMSEDSNSDSSSKEDTPPPAKDKYKRGKDERNSPKSRSSRDSPKSYRSRRDEDERGARKDDRENERGERLKERSRDSKHRDSRYREERKSRRSPSREKQRSRSPRYRNRRSNSRDRGGPAAKSSGYTRRFDRASNKMAQLEKLGIEIKTPDCQFMSPSDLQRSMEEQKRKGEAENRFFMPGITGRFREQIERRKMLWQKKEPEKKEALGVAPATAPPRTSAGRVWESTTFAQDTDGKVANKFKRLMGIKGTTDEAKPATDTLKKQEEMFSSMEAQYEVARTATHTMRGVGLGFGSFQR